MIRQAAEQERGLDRSRTPMIIFSCARCGRSVKVFGRVRRVICACGRVLFEAPSFIS